MKLMEMDMHQAEITAQKEKQEIECERMGLERMKLQHEKEIKQVELDSKDKVDQDVVKQLKWFGEALSQMVGPNLMKSLISPLTF